MQCVIVSSLAMLCISAVFVFVRRLSVCLSHFSCQNAILKAKLYVLGIYSNEGQTKVEHKTAMFTRAVLYTTAAFAVERCSSVRLTDRHKFIMRLCIKTA